MLSSVAYRSMATIYLSYGLYEEMQSALDYISSNFEMDDELLPDYNNFVSLMTIAQNMQESNLYEEGLSEAQRTSLETVLTDDRPLIAPIALALLKRDNPDYVYNEAVYDVPQSSPRLASPNYNDATVVVNPDFKLYPNPTFDYTTLQYNCQYSYLNYSIIDLSGREIKKGSLKTIENSKTNEVLINLGDLSPSNYQIIIKSNSIILWSEKLIVTE